MSLPFAKPARRRKRRRNWRTEITPDELLFVEFVERSGCSVLPCMAGPLVDFDHVPSIGHCGKAHAEGWGLCRQHHTERHTTGLYTFCTKYNLDVVGVIAALHREFRRSADGPSF